MERVYAVDIKTLSPTTFSQFSDFGSFVSVIIANATYLAGIILFIIMVVGGFRFMQASGSGDTKQMEQGKKAITASLLGFILIVTAVWLVQLVSYIFYGTSSVAPGL